MMSDFSKQPLKLTLFRPARALSFLMESLSRLKTSAMLVVLTFLLSLGVGPLLHWPIAGASAAPPAGSPAAIVPLSVRVGAAGGPLQQRARRASRCSGRAGGLRAEVPPPACQVPGPATALIVCVL